MPLQILRIIDANCNRISEGLRLLEDIVRFLLNDAILSQQLKAMRHEVVQSLSKLGADMLSARDSETDVGASAQPLSQRHDLSALISANARRAEEGLRVMEELSKLPELSQGLRSVDFQRKRFEVYALERQIISRVTGKEKLSRLTGLYVIIDTETLGLKGEVETASKAIRGGASTIQLRDKLHSRGQLLAIARQIRDLCSESGVLFMMNDYLDIALAADADGLHVGDTDLPLPVIRRELPVGRLVGCSTHSLAQAVKAASEGADYIAVGSIFPSPTKKHATVIGVGQLRQIRQAISIPIVAIGGISRDNITQVLGSGADAAAVISAAMSYGDVEQAVRQLVAKIESKTQGLAEF